jgi:hypothetical protein
MRFLLLIFALCFGLTAVPAFAEQPAPAKQDVAAPIVFVENGGQWPGSVFFSTKQGSVATYLEKTIITTQLFQTESKGVVIKSHFLDTDKKLAVSGELPSEARFNYLRGPQENWKTGMRAYQRVLYKNIYADTDLEISAGKNGIEQVFILNGKTAPDIRIKVEGIQKLSVNDKGELVMETESGELLQSAPHVVRKSGKIRKKITARYEIVDDTTYILSL